MKNLMKLISLVGLMTLVSCGSGTSTKELAACINGDKEICKEITPVEPPTTVEPAFSVEEIETINFRGKEVTFDKVETWQSPAIEWLRFVNRDSYTVMSGGEEVLIRTVIVLRLAEDGTFRRTLGEKFGSNAWTYSSKVLKWKIDGEGLKVGSEEFGYLPYETTLL